MNNLKYNRDKGFTLIELIMVIVILGILAAVAIPKFVDVKSDAKKSVKDGVTAALRGAVTMLHGKYIISTSSTYDATTVIGSVDAQGVTLANGAAVITVTLSDASTATWTYTANAGVSTPAIISGPTPTN